MKRSLSLSLSLSLVNTPVTRARVLGLVKPLCAYVFVSDNTILATARIKRRL